MKTSEILRRARKIHYDRTRLVGENIYKGLCRSIGMVEVSGRAKTRQAAIQKRIDNALGLHAFVQDWLFNKDHITYEQYRDGELMTEYRLRWLDALIDEYESKGD